MRILILVNLVIMMMMTVTLKATYRNGRLHHSECFHMPGDDSRSLSERTLG